MTVNETPYFTDTPAGGVAIIPAATNEPLPLFKAGLYGAVLHSVRLLSATNATFQAELLLTLNGVTVTTGRATISTGGDLLKQVLSPGTFATIKDVNPQWPLPAGAQISVRIVSFGAPQVSVMTDGAQFKRSTAGAAANDTIIPNTPTPLLNGPAFGDESTTVTVNITNWGQLESATISFLIDGNPNTGTVINNRDGTLDWTLPLSAGSSPSLHALTVLARNEGATTSSASIEITANPVETSAELSLQRQGGYTGPFALVRHVGTGVEVEVAFPGENGQTWPNPATFANGGTVEVIRLYLQQSEGYAEFTSQTNNLPDLYTAGALQDPLLIPPSCNMTLFMTGVS